jgi:hypothetical protein
MKQKSRSPKQRKHPKTRLRLPDLEFSKSAVLNSLTSVDGQRGYGHAIDEFVDWYCSEPRLALNRTVVLRYRSYLEARLLAPGTVNLRLGAVRRLAYEAADSGLLSSDLAASRASRYHRGPSVGPFRRIVTRSEPEAERRHWHRSAEESDRSPKERRQRPLDGEDGLDMQSPLGLTNKSASRFQPPVQPGFRNGSPPGPHCD